MRSSNEETALICSFSVWNTIFRELTWIHVIYFNENLLFYQQTLTFAKLVYVGDNEASDCCFLQADGIVTRETTSDNSVPIKQKFISTKKIAKCR